MMEIKTNHPRNGSTQFQFSQQQSGRIHDLGVGKLTPGTRKQAARSHVSWNDEFRHFVMSSSNHSKQEKKDDQKDSTPNRNTSTKVVSDVEKLMEAIDDEKQQQEPAADDVTSRTPFVRETSLHLDDLGAPSPPRNKLLGGRYGGSAPSLQQRMVKSTRGKSLYNASWSSPPPLTSTSSSSSVSVLNLTTSTSTQSSSTPLVSWGNEMRSNMMVHRKKPNTQPAAFTTTQQQRESRRNLLRKSMSFHNGASSPKKGSGLDSYIQRDKPQVRRDSMQAGSVRSENYMSVKVGDDGSLQTSCVSMPAAQQSGGNNDDCQVMSLEERFQLRRHHSVSNLRALHKTQIAYQNLEEEHTTLRAQQKEIVAKQEQRRATYRETMEQFEKIREERSELEDKNKQLRERKAAIEEELRMMQEESDEEDTQDIHGETTAPPRSAKSLMRRMNSLRQLVEEAVEEYQQCQFEGSRMLQSMMVPAVQLASSTVEDDQAHLEMKRMEKQKSVSSLKRQIRALKDEVDLLRRNKITTIYGDSLTCVSSMTSVASSL